MTWLSSKSVNRGLRVQIGSQRKVNDGHESVNIGKRGRVKDYAESDANCSYCTAAAILIHATGEHWTSGKVAAEIGQRFQISRGLAYWGTRRNSLVKLPGQSGLSNLEKDIDDQIDGLTHWVRRKLGFCACAVLGAKGNPAPLIDALQWMRSLTDNPLFAVNISNAGHWVFAHQLDGDIEFIDYQTDKVHEPGSSPRHGKIPMVGVLNERCPNATLIVIAFWPGRVGGVMPPASCGNRAFALPAVVPVNGP